MNNQWRMVVVYTIITIGVATLLDTLFHVRAASFKGITLVVLAYGSIRFYTEFARELIHG